MASIAAAHGMRLSRAAFAVMLKYSSNLTQFSDLVDEIDILDSEYDENDPDRNANIQT
jgi:hypothetical protein